jgi:hypothetical protein
MRKVIAAGAVVAAVAGTMLFGAGRADAGTQICAAIAINGDSPVPPLPVALPVAPPVPIQTGTCIPPDGVIPGLPPLPPLPV